MISDVRSDLRSRMSGGLVGQVRLALAALAVINVVAGGIAAAVIAADGRALWLTALLTIWLTVVAIRERFPPGGTVIEAALLAGHLLLTGTVAVAMTPFYTTMLFRASYDRSARTTLVRSAVYLGAFAVAYITDGGDPLSAVTVFLTAQAAAFIAVPQMIRLLTRSLADQDDTILQLRAAEAARAAAQQQLLRAQRMESIGTLAGGVAHDLNNVLSPIQLAAELLLATERPESDKELLTTIITSAKRGSDLVSQVLTFARGVDGKRAPVDVEDVLAVVRAIVRDTFPRNIILELSAETDLPEVVADATQIEQVLLNLVVNARDAMPEGGRLMLRATSVRIDAASASGIPEATPGPYLRIEVEDTGTGMPFEIRERIFEPFFTTKPQGAGTGLGLSTSVGIIRSHGGWMNVYSEPGTGTTFRLYLPIVSDGGAPPIVDRAEALPQALLRGSGEVILLVDDEALIRTMTRQTLEAHGYQVIEAANGAEAFARFMERGEEIDLVLTDMMMPIMDGPATIRALLKIDPDVIIVGASGLHGNGEVAQAANAGVKHFIPKPYTTETLLRTFAEALAVRSHPKG